LPEKGRTVKPGIGKLAFKAAYKLLLHLPQNIASFGHEQDNTFDTTELSSKFGVGRHGPINLAQQ